jgi:hydrogenase expression/formation protein HypE
MTADLIRRTFLPHLNNEILAALEDQATIQLAGINGRSHRLAFTTDAFVVRPIVFPGGDIGRLAVHGTVNDLAVGGALPLFLAAAFILEEGLRIEDLDRIVCSMRLLTAPYSIVRDATGSRHARACERISTSRPIS